MEQTSVNLGGSGQPHMRDLRVSLWRGFRCLCPSCGNEKLFQSGLAVFDRCSACKEHLHHHRADDLPAYLNIFLVGHLVVGLMLLLFKMEIFEVLTLGALSIGLALFLSFLLMRPLKGAVVGAQWALKMHGFADDVR